MTEFITKSYDFKGAYMKYPDLQILNAGTWYSPEGVARSHPRFVMRYEVELFLSPTTTWVDGVAYMMQAGDCLFCVPGQLRCSEFPMATRFLYFDFVKPQAEAASFLQTLPTQVSHDLEIAGWITKIVSHFPAPDYVAGLRLQTDFMEMLLAFSDSAAVRVPARFSQRQTALYTAICFMKNHLQQNCTVADFAAAAGYSPAHFTEFFKEMLGCSPYAYFLYLKIQEAKRLLLAGEDTVTQISQKLAFYSSGHFCNTFRRFCGQSPSAFLSTAFFPEPGE